MLNRFLGFVCCASLCLFTLTAHGRQYRYSADAETKFAAALQYFKEHQFNEAALAFESLRKQVPVHQRTSAAFLMSAKALFELKEYKLARDVAQEFLREFPASSYRPDAHYLLGLSDLMFQQYDASLGQFLEAALSADDPELRRQAGEMMESVVSRRLSPQDLEELYVRSEGHSKRSYLALFLAESYHRKGEDPRAREVMRRVSIADSSGEFAKRYFRLERQLSASINVKIGALLPRRQGAAKGLADEIFEGMQFALAEFKKNAPPSAGVGLEVRDTDQDSSHLFEPMTQLAEAQDVVAIVGPLFSTLAAAYAPLANKAKVALISPTATANGIAASGPYVFQANPDFAMRGKAMARYAVQRLGFARVAVLNSSDPKARAVGEAFAEEAARLGATVVANESYGKDTTDLREQLVAIRKTSVEGGARISFAGKISPLEIKAMLRAGANRAVLQHARRRGEAVELTKLFGPRGERIADSLHLRVIPPQQQFISLEIPVTSIDGIFISLTSSEEMGVVAPQISYFNLRTQILGSAEWYDPPQLEANKRYVNGAVFISDSYADREDSTYMEFEKAFRQEYGKPPTKNTLYGYDSMAMILDQIARGATTREQIAAALRSVDGYPGLHAPITLSHGRVNSNLHILKYSGGEITKIAEVAQ